MDRYALLLPEESRESLATSSGLAFIPFSPAKPRLRGVTQRDDVLMFSQKELQLYETRYVNGYDLPGDERYNSWLIPPQEADSLHDTTFTPDSPGYEWNSYSLTLFSPLVSPISSTCSSPLDDLLNESRRGVRRTGKAATAQSCKLVTKMTV